MHPLQELQLLSHQSALCCLSPGAVHTMWPHVLTCVDLYPAAAFLSITYDTPFDRLPPVMQAELKAIK